MRADPRPIPPPLLMNEIPLTVADGWLETLSTRTAPTWFASSRGYSTTTRRARKSCRTPSLR